MALNPYNPTSTDAVQAWARIHGNGEQTHVHILTAGDDAYVAVAVDIDPREYEAVASEVLAFDPTLEGVVARAERWMEQNPKGIADAAGDGSGSTVMAVLRKLNDYGNSLTDQQPPPGQQSGDDPGEEA